MNLKTNMIHLSNKAVTQQINIISMRTRIKTQRTIKTLFGYKVIYATLERRCNADGEILLKHTVKA